MSDTDSSSEESDDDIEYEYYLVEEEVVKAEGKRVKKAPAKPKARRKTPVVVPRKTKPTPKPQEEEEEEELLEEELSEEEMSEDDLDVSFTSESGMSSGLSVQVPVIAAVPSNEETFEGSSVHSLVSQEEDEMEDVREAEKDPFLIGLNKYAPSRVQRMNERVNDPRSPFMLLCTDQEFLSSALVSRRVMDEETVRIDKLSNHLTGFEYVCPRVEVEKGAGKSLIKHKRLWEVNIVDRVHNNLKRNDQQLKSTFPFDTLSWVELRPEENVVIIRLREKNKKPRVLKCGSKAVMWKLYELFKFSIAENPTWIPQLLSSRQRNRNQTLKKISLKGTIDYQMSKGKGIEIEKKNLKGTTFMVGPQYERISLYCVTWKLKGGKLPKGDKAKDYVFKKLIRPGANLYAICLQALDSKEWKEGVMKDYIIGFFKRNFQDNYVLVNGTRCGDVGMYVFIEKRYCRTISKIRWTKKTFPKSVSGGSGCVSIRILFNESHVAFVGLHLPESLKLKEHLIQEIFENDEDIDDCHVFLLGDFGYSLSLSPEIAVSMANRGRDLLHYDAFLNHKIQSGILYQFREGQILFLPNEPIEGKPGKKCHFTLNRGPLAYSGRVLVKSYPGVECRCLAYRTIRTLPFVCPYAPVYSVMAFDTQRTHVSHFSKPCQPKMIRVVQMAVVNNVEAESIFKVPQIVMEGDWLEKTPVGSHKGTTGKVPRFVSKDFDECLWPVKSSKEFLSSVFLKISLMDNKELKCRGTLNVGLAMKNEGWFTIELCLKTKLVCELMGLIEIVQRE